ncbi:MAG: hypothetical protein QMC70_03825 [Bacteroidia bacterium]|jgi:hypothetical protein|tara:strand:+ start:25549 stop:25974 length:426 start_codon:yes stop_codon:yes gene_type:complete
MKELAITALILLTAIAADAQTQEVVLEIGDTLYFDQCSGDNYTYIDYFQKTRFEKDKPLHDTATGMNYYTNFFDTGDFDVHRMPCKMKGRYGIIKHMMQVELEEIGTQAVFITEIEKGKTAAYIIELAFSRGEVLWSPAPR